MPSLKNEFKYLTTHTGFICSIIFYFFTYFYGNTIEYFYISTTSFTFFNL